MMNVGLPQKFGQASRPLFGPGENCHQEDDGDAEGNAEHDDLPVEVDLNT